MMGHGVVNSITFEKMRDSFSNVGLIWDLQTKQLSLCARNSANGVPYLGAELAKIQKSSLPENVGISLTLLCFSGQAVNNNQDAVTIAPSAGYCMEVTTLLTVFFKLVDFLFTGQGIYSNGTGILTTQGVKRGRINDILKNKKYAYWFRANSPIFAITWKTK